MSKEHKVVIIPGLGDDTKHLRLAVAPWNRKGLTPIVYSVDWRNGEGFEPKLEGLLTLVDKLEAEGNLISLVGTSAGGSAALNAFVKRLDAVHRVINVCGRLRVGPTTGYRSFDSMTKTSLAFAQAVKMFEGLEGSISTQDIKRIMTVRSLLGDELVPKSTTIIEGARNIWVPTPEHVISIGASLTVFSHRLIEFLTQE
ncbi:MAG: hypothetical protein COY80_03760 [Candidatus Pacebacteria bacterium CG_4_10_14_0_8_um_filter_42_14]|nr:MAG: hypothetical protein COY80_03760 [Candidatus Pacebacteria bacterium CG_4_10_14_0_8_um_filter_42_14]